LKQRVGEPEPALEEVATRSWLFRLLLSEEQEHFEVAFLTIRHQFITVEHLFSGTVIGT
jgi:DNA repair protein RadC